MGGGEGGDEVEAAGAVSPALAARSVGPAEGKVTF